MTDTEKIENLQERIDKAIEYIENSLLEVNANYDEEDDGDYEEYRKERLDILKDYDVSGTDMPAKLIIKILDILKGEDE